ALNILQTGADQITALANAAIDGIRAWETAAVNAANAAASAQIDEIRKAADTAIAAARSTADEQIAAVNKATDESVAANEAQITALQAQKQTLQDVISLSKDWQRIVESIDKMISDLMTGS